MGAHESQLAHGSHLLLQSRTRAERNSGRTRGGSARTSTARQELASQLEALRRVEWHKVFKEQISTWVKVRPELEKAFALAHQFKEAAPETPVILTVHEPKRLARNAAELMTLSAELQAGRRDGAHHQDREERGGWCLGCRWWLRYCGAGSGFGGQDVRMGTVVELVGQARVAFGAGDWSGYEDLMWRAGGEGVGALAVGLGLIRSGDPVEREMGCDLLGKASDQNEACRAETVVALVALAEREGEADVLAALARAVEMTYDPRAVPVLVVLAGHPDAGVRREVACSFPGVLTGSPDGPDVHALIALTRDQDPEVRNWATFTLGSQAEADGPAIREALWARTSDENADVREEGIHGLARRRDPRAVPLLVELLGNPEGAHVLTFRAAEAMGAPELLPALLEYEAEGAGVAAAVEACDPARRAAT
ncbi:HEAT repeat domain-containing protein [Streptomyces sp. NBC_00454]|uniref:HEAT repeat domain-containing protein n=1 Tax=Streptomyces sp. NBC_00454 TaxID=2975747 RepID=UPI00324BC7A4